MSKAEIKERREARVEAYKYDVLSLMDNFGLNPDYDIDKLERMYEKDLEDF